jgi:hypothetical protein
MGGEIGMMEEWNGGMMECGGGWNDGALECWNDESGRMGRMDIGTLTGKKRLASWAREPIIAV